eukprot:TRINITY_DN10838_c0_g1_i1.p1 TRINITY_DN10838_c0_g1~~TRINITY_DN10838_c0_g1_i1.p1  ORF type:complete len:918 (+),score=221.32 TRINITY_DN10838_c0_g1_i1:46-2799(+)
MAMFNMLGAIAALLLLNWSPAESACAITAAQLTVEFGVEPIGIDSAAPRLSWILQELDDTVRNQTQSAYRILVASTAAILQSNVGDLWDSNIQNSSNSLAIPYAGKALSSGMQAFWKVFVWDGTGVQCEPSVPSSWEAGIVATEDWHGTWIQRNDAPPATDCDCYNDDPVPLFRKQFSLAPGKTVARARAYVTGLGYFVLYIDGQRVSDNELEPGWTSYASTVPYAAYDVAIGGPEFVVGIMLGNGWYNPLPLRMWGSLDLRQQLTIGLPTTLLQLNVWYTDGSMDSFSTDSSWKVGNGPIIRNNIYLGEVYDARAELPGWSALGFNDSSWSYAVQSKPPTGALRFRMIPPVRRIRTLPALSMKQQAPDTFIFDIGVNLAAGVSLSVAGPTKAGVSILLRYGEILNPDGSLNVMTSVAGQIKSQGQGGPCAPAVAWQSDTVILKGVAAGSVENYTSTFTWHGFQFIELTCTPACSQAGISVGLDTVSAYQLNTDLTSIGNFTSSSPLLNSIQAMVRTSLLSNMISVQSDCPHRERFGYGGDAVASAEAALLNFDMRQMYGKRLDDYVDAVRPNGGFTETAPFNGIADASMGGQSGPIIWQSIVTELQQNLYTYSGDMLPMQKYYRQTKAFVDFLLSVAPTNFIVQVGLGDWSSIATRDVPVSSTAFLYRNVLLFSEFAGLLGQEDDVRKYSAIADEIAMAFNSAFLNRTSGVYSIGTQCDQAFALYMGLAPQKQTAQVFQALVNSITAANNHVTVGIQGLKYMLQVLSDFDRADLALAMMSQSDYPSFGYMLAQNATSLWEVWEWSDNTYSHNHGMFAAVSEWFFKGLGGISAAVDSVGFDHILVRPTVAGDLTWVNCSYISARGLVESNWRLVAGTLQLDVRIPANAKGTVVVPSPNGTTTYEIGSGLWHWSVAWN